MTETRAFDEGQGPIQQTWAPWGVDGTRPELNGAHEATDRYRLSVAVHRRVHGAYERLGLHMGARSYHERAAVGRWVGGWMRG